MPSKSGERRGGEKPTKIRKNRDTFTKMSLCPTKNKLLKEQRVILQSLSQKGFSMQSDGADTYSRNPLK